MPYQIITDGPFEANGYNARGELEEATCYTVQLDPSAAAELGIQVCQRVSYEQFLNSEPAKLEVDKKNDPHIKVKEVGIYAGAASKKRNLGFELDECPLDKQYWADQVKLTEFFKKMERDEVPSYEAASFLSMTPKKVSLSFEMRCQEAISILHPAQAMNMRLLALQPDPTVQQSVLIDPEIPSRARKREQKAASKASKGIKQLGERPDFEFGSLTKELKKR